MSLDLVRRQALEMLGYTPRQAHFLVLVALHGGYFLRRQYVAFTGRAHGQAAVRFLSHCVAREHVTVFPYGRQGHVYHLCARPLYAALGEEDNRNRRPAEWEAILRKLMTVDFVLANPTARFWATEEEKVALLRERQISASVWPQRQYQPRRAGRATTVRYFVDKMPWYQEADESRLWIAYVDAERTLGGFETFLDQYRTVLASLPSGVTYVAATVWQSVIEAAFARGLAPRDAGVMDRFSAYCQFRRAVEDAGRTAPLTPDQHVRFHEQCAEFTTPAFEALYQHWLKTSSVASWEVDAAARPPCVLRMHALGRRYDPGHTPSDSSGCQVRVT